MISGFATQTATEAFLNRFKEKTHGDHFQSFQSLSFSSVGLGSYLGLADVETDAKYVSAVKGAVSLGVNVLDTAINYRCQRSEKNYGLAIKEMIESGSVKREELIICSKAGFLPFENEAPLDPLNYFKEKYIETGLLDEENISQGCHAMTPDYLETQLESTLKNMGVECIDIYYIHNPETQLADIDSIKFRDRMRHVFEWMESKVTEGKIKYYGTATWNGYRLQRNQADYLSLEELNLLAREVAGQHHHFKFVQLPFNLAMPEAWILPNQLFGKQEMSLLQIAGKLDIGVIASASLLQAKLTGELPEFLNPYFEELETSAQRALQFSRSVKGILTALVGMKEDAHIQENLKVLKVEKLSEEKLIMMFQNPNPTN